MTQHGSKRTARNTVPSHERPAFSTSTGAAEGWDRCSDQRFRPDSWVAAGPTVMQTSFCCAGLQDVIRLVRPPGRHLPSSPLNPLARGSHWRHSLLALPQRSARPLCTVIGSRASASAASTHFPTSSHAPMLCAIVCCLMLWARWECCAASASAASQALLRYQSTTGRAALEPLTTSVQLTIANARGGARTYKNAHSDCN